MNTTVKVAIGALIGGGIGYFVGAVIEAYIRLKDDQPIPQYHEDNEMPDFNLPNKEPDMKKTNRRPRDYTKSFDPEMKESLENLVKKYNHGITAETEVNSDNAGPIQDEDIALINETDPEKDIEIISVADFANSDLEYDQLTFNYYSDDILTDEDDDPIQDSEAWIGPDALVSFGQLSQDEDVVYVRNNTRKTEIEVVRLNKPYLAEETEEKRTRRIRPEYQEEEYGGDEEDA